MPLGVVQVSQNMFDVLKRFVSPTYREEGPPEFVREMVDGLAISGEGAKPDAPIRSILELMTIGYRPATSLAILNILSDSPNLAMNGTQIARELEKRFGVQEGWFTKTRYYTDRVSKLLRLLTRLGLIQEFSRKDSRTGRMLPVYQVNPSLREPITTRLEALSRGEELSLFPFRQPERTISISQNRMNKVCPNCDVMSNSTIARYCEICGNPLQVTCRNCNATVEAIYSYCVKCGTKIT